VVAYFVGHPVGGRAECVCRGRRRSASAEVQYQRRAGGPIGSGAPRRDGEKVRARLPAHRRRVPAASDRTQHQRNHSDRDHEGNLGSVVRPPAGD